jgi:hypothetical protein
MSESEIVRFLTEANGWKLPTGYNDGMNYSLGSVVVEILVAIRGQDSILALYEAMSKKMTFAEAFQNVYGISWNEAIPILAKTIYANNNGL